MKILCTSQGWNKLAKNRCKDFRAFALGRFLSTLDFSIRDRFLGGSPSKIRLFSSLLARGDGVYRLRGRIIGDRRCRALRLELFELLESEELFTTLGKDFSGVLDAQAEVSFTTLIELTSN